MALEATGHALCFVCQTLSCALSFRHLGVLETVETGPTARSSFVRSHPRHAPIVEASRASAEYSGASLRPRPAVGGAPTDARLSYAVGCEARLSRRF